MAALHAVIVSGALRAIWPASVTTASSSSATGTTRLTSPTFSASADENRRAENRISDAIAGFTWCISWRTPLKP